MTLAAPVCSEPFATQTATWLTGRAATVVVAAVVDEAGFFVVVVLAVVDVAFVVEVAFVVDELAPAAVVVDEPPATTVEVVVRFDTCAGLVSSSAWSPITPAMTASPITTS